MLRVLHITTDLRMLKYSFHVSSKGPIPRDLFSLDQGFKVLAVSKTGPCVCTHIFKIWIYDWLCKCYSICLSDSNDGIPVLAECFSWLGFFAGFCLWRITSLSKTLKTHIKITKCCFSSGGSAWSSRQALNVLGSSHKSFKYVMCLYVSFLRWDGRNHLV